MPGYRSLAVVIPTHGACGLLLECLASLAAAGLPQGRIWVVDDASRDGTAAAVRERFPDVGLLADDRRAGFSAAANCGGFATPCR